MQAKMGYEQHCLLTPWAQTITRLELSSCSVILACVSARCIVRYVYPNCRNAGIAVYIVTQ